MSFPRLTRPILKIGEVTGFMTSEDNDPFYTKKRFFKKESTLQAYLLKYYKNQITEANEHCLPEILNLIMMRIKIKQMYDKENPFMVECDTELARALGGVVYILTSDIQFEVIKQLIPNAEDYIRTGGEDKIEGKSPTVDERILYAPYWLTDSKAVKAQLCLQKIQKGKVYLLKPALRSLLLKYDAMKADEIHFSFYDLIQRLGIAILKSGPNFDNKNRMALILKDTDLEKLFGVPALDVRQLDGFLAQQIEHAPPPINPTDPRQIQARNIMLTAIEALYKARRERGEPVQTTQESIRQKIAELELGIPCKIDDTLTVFLGTCDEEVSEENEEKPMPEKENI